MSATMTWNMSEFGATMRLLHERNRRAPSSLVTFWGRKLVRKAAYGTPIAGGGFAARGRARAGWWPAALGLGVANVYTPQPNAGEGVFVDGRGAGDKASVTIGNSVPYITRMSVGLGWFGEAVAGVEAQMRNEAEREYREVCR